MYKKLIFIILTALMILSYGCADVSIAPVVQGSPDAQDAQPTPARRQ